MTAESKRSVVFLLMEIVNGGDLRALDEACALSLSWHANGVVDRRGQAALRAHLLPLLVAIPDLTVSVDDLLVDGDRVACRFRWHGTHLGDYGDVAATGRVAAGGGLAIFRVTAGKIVEAWWQDDVNALTDRLRAAVPAAPAQMLTRFWTDAA